MRTTAIASGSNGNCYFMESGNDSILVDAGLSCKELVHRMSNLGLSAKRLSGLFITHEHSDHIRGVEVLSKKFDIPVYVTEGTFNASNFRVNDRLLNLIKCGSSITMGNIAVNPFTKNHDAAEPCSFMLNAEGYNVAVMTDIGEKCANVVDAISKANVAFLETNYDELMLEKSNYPYPLKQRIGGNMGHFSNYQASLLVLEHANPCLKHVFLSHLSANNNTPELAYQTFTGFLKERKDLSINAIMTSRHKESELLELE
ncbi:MBL fold metallo-hydrolase [Candidatus Woesearchaeota archaeon]|nr:MBL fold metallo-hydrolase [Candidatus Woesearchaeota archaeon]